MSPLKWLLDRLPDYVPADQLDGLLIAYRANKVAYERQIAINKVERIIKTTERFAPSIERDARLARWRAKLDKLKSEAL